MKSHVTFLKFLPIGVASSTLALTVLVSPVALARQGTDDNVSTVNTGTTSTNETHQTRTGSSTVATTTSAENEQETGDDTLRAQAKSLLQTERQKGKEHSTAQRQKACEAHKAELTKREANYAAAAQRHLNTFNAIFTKVQAFHDSKQLTVANYDTLVATAKTKQAAAQTAVDELKALDVSIDCTQSDPASTVAELKTAVKNARTALQDYRAAIKDVIVALKGASTSATSDSTGGDQ